MSHESLSFRIVDLDKRYLSYAESRGFVPEVDTDDNICFLNAGRTWDFENKNTIFLWEQIVLLTSIRTLSVWYIPTIIDIAIKLYSRTNG